jgi:hypothetical protein
MNAEQAGQILNGHAPDDELLQFVRALVEAGKLTEVEGLVYFLEKPWKYADEFVSWDHFDRPMDDSEPGWDAFAQAIE